METIVLGGLPIIRASRAEFAAQMVWDCRDELRPFPKVSFSANGFSIAKANRDHSYASMLSQADYIDADGMPLVFASRLKYDCALPERIATTDFFHDAARLAEKNGLSFYFLGGTPEINAMLADKVAHLYPQLAIAGHHHGYFSLDDEESVFAKIKSCKPDVVWVGMGSPRQENVALRLGKQAPRVGWIKTCGGLFDHVLERHPRAPRWMQVVGLEWLHRMIREPRRLAWRYLWSNPVALYYLLTKSSRKKNILAPWQQSA